MKSRIFFFLNLRTLFIFLSFFLLSFFLYFVTILHASERKSYDKIFCQREINNICPSDQYKTKQDIRRCMKSNFMNLSERCRRFSQDNTFLPVACKAEIVQFCTSKMNKSKQQKNNQRQQQKNKHYANDRQSYQSNEHLHKYPQLSVTPKQCLKILQKKFKLNSRQNDISYECGQALNVNNSFKGILGVRVRKIG